MRKNITIVGISVVLFLLALWLAAMQENQRNEGEQVACTLEALVCPDGSAVGRSGPECRFTACPAIPSFTGVLQDVGDGYQLIIETPEEIVGDVTYALPLEVRTTNVFDAYVGKVVRVRGEFTHGNTYAVTDIVDIPSGYGAPTATLSVGESALIGYVKVTLNDIVEDSRCPSDVECIQAGRVAAEVTLESDTDEETRNIYTHGTSVLFDAFSVSIVDVTPTPVSTRTIPDGEYEITVMVEQINQ